MRCISYIGVMWTVLYICYLLQISNGKFFYCLAFISWFTIFITEISDSSLFFSDVGGFVRLFHNIMNSDKHVVMYNI